MPIIQPKTTVVVPTYNERENLPLLVRALEDLRLPGLQLLVVDDSSPDGTGDVAERLARRSPLRISVLHRRQKDGLGRAYVAGMTKALAEGADIVVQMDADLSHPVSTIPTMVSRILSSDASIVVGSRYVAGGSVAEDWAWKRRVLSAGANWYVNLILGLRVKDATAGFKAWRASALELIDLPSIRSSGYAFQVEMNYRARRSGERIAEVPIHFDERVSGASKMTLGVQVESMLMPWRLLLSRWHPRSTTTHQFRQQDRAETKRAA